MPPKRRPAIDRVLEKVTYDHGCWKYNGYRLKGGYGLIGSANGNGTPGKLTHRLTYEALIGPIPAGLHLDHLCRNRACCNPMHLEPVTQLENVARGAGNAGRSRLSKQDIATIKERAAAGETQESIAADFGVSRPMISNVVRGRAGWSATGEPNSKAATRPMSERTHCPRGHEYTPENIQLYKNRRYCRECRRDDCRERYYRSKSTA